ncbi:hypothetical protein GKZ92_12740 [Gordonia sp. 135]|nr:hypothetical protein [Gordonia sp. 135]QGP88428.1 hypothetical protein GKZ92_12740 [Gordonia sp. 135]
MTKREEEKRARRKHRQLAKKVNRPVFYALAVDGNPIRNENGEMIGVWIA